MPRLKEHLGTVNTNPLRPAQIKRGLFAKLQGKLVTSTLESQEHLTVNLVVKRSGDRRPRHAF